MITLFNIWHYLFFIMIFIFFVLSMVYAFWQKKNIPSILLSSFLISTLATIATIYWVDSFTKKANIVNLKYKRIYNTEQIVFSGIVQNIGKYDIGEVELEIKLLNKEQFSKSAKGGTFFDSDNFFGSLLKGEIQIQKPQQISQKFIVSKKIKAGGIEYFTVYMPYPPYFGEAMQYFELTLH